MTSIEDAQALCAQEQDPFYLDAFMMEWWLGHLILAAAAEYAEKKHARERHMQSGEAWRSFMIPFKHAKDDEFHHVFNSLLRFAEYDDVQAAMLRNAMRPLSLEHECHGDYVGPKTMEGAKQPGLAVPLMRQTVEWWCEWLDALIHFQTHASWHLQPAKFDPDPQKRELAALGVNQRNFAKLGEFGQAWWHWHHGEAAERFKNSAKWATLGKAMASEATRHWNYPEVDAAVISLWPLVKRHRWTYRDLLNVMRAVIPKHQRYPCEREQDLATYCTNVLGLRKRATGKTSKPGRPKGYDVALRLFQREA
jgi:hypothetical protein